MAKPLSFYLYDIILLFYELDYILENESCFYKAESADAEAERYR